MVGLWILMMSFVVMRKSTRCSAVSVPGYYSHKKVGGKVTGSSQYYCSYRGGLYHIHLLIPPRPSSYSPCHCLSHLLLHSSPDPIPLVGPDGVQ